MLLYSCILAILNLQNNLEALRRLTSPSSESVSRSSIQKKFIFQVSVISLASIILFLYFPVCFSQVSLVIFAYFLYFLLCISQVSMIQSPEPAAPNGNGWRPVPGATSATTGL